MAAPGVVELFSIARASRDAPHPAAFGHSRCGASAFFPAKNGGRRRLCPPPGKGKGARCAACASTADSATICKQQKVISSEEGRRALERRAKSSMGYCSALLFDCFRIVIFVCPIVLAALHHLPRAHFFFNDFKQLARYWSQRAPFSAIVFSLFFTMAAPSLAAPHRRFCAHPPNQQRSGSNKK
jgi:hypothetical protein